MEDEATDHKEIDPTENVQNSDIGILTKNVSMQGGNGVNFQGGIINHFGLGNESKEDKVFCPKCNTAPDESESGRIKCKKCSTIYFVSSIFSPRISSYPNLQADKNQQYKDLIAHISNFIILGNYQVADEFCSFAIEQSPATPQAWEYKALCSYFLTNDKKYLIDTHAEKISRFLVVAKSHYENEEELDTIGSYKPITERLAERIFNMINFRIFWARINIEDIESKRTEISELIYSFRICYKIHPYNPYYLETILDMYLGYDEESWIDVIIDETANDGYTLKDNSHLDDNLFDLIKVLTSQIKQHNKNYKQKEMKVGSFEDEPVELSILLAKRKKEYEILKEAERQEEKRKLNLQKMLDISTQ
jgi:hypothetical protein